MDRRTPPERLLRARYRARLPLARRGSQTPAHSARVLAIQHTAYATVFKLAQPMQFTIDICISLAAVVGSLLFRLIDCLLQLGVQSLTNGDAGLTGPWRAESPRGIPQAPIR